MHRTSLLLGVVLSLAHVAAGAQPTGEAETPLPDGIAVPAEATPIMTLDQVRVGMKGYGKTVFQGSDIEPFPIEVVSVISDSSAKRGTIWVVCPGERMTRSGPVQGMSGSPMFLWDEGEEGVVGEGGRLIGAFAFGYPEVNVCLVGVQPIEYMREVGERATDEDWQDDPVRQATPGMASRSLASLAHSIAGLRQSMTPTGLSGAAATGPLAFEAAKIAHMQRSLQPRGWRPPASGHDTPQAVGVAGPMGRDPAAVVPLGLPLSVGDESTARLLAPLLAPAGIRVMAGDLTAVAGKPPSNVVASEVRLEPGSVLSIPLAYGDLDLSAAGTVTDIMPDGTVLAFGHAMDAVGSSRLPMATGYTHFVVSRDSISFKQAGSLDIVGSVVRDEASAVAGIREVAFASAPVTVRIEMPGQPVRDYSYRVIDQIALTPAIVGAVVNGSLTAVQAPPLLHTMYLSGSMTFSDGRRITLDSALPGGGRNNLAFELLPPIIAMMQNPFEPLQLESADLTIRVEPVVREAQIVSAHLDRTVVQAGETLNVSAVIQPFDAPRFTTVVPLALPTDLVPGDYTAIVSGATSYLNRFMASHPDLAEPDSIGELRDTLQAIADIKRDVLYVSVPRLTPSLAVSGRRMPDIPSSRVAVLGASGASNLMPYPTFVDARQDNDWLVDGELQLMFKVVEEQP